MLYRFSLSTSPSDDLDTATDPSSDDQRARPRTGPIEKIADIAYDTLRKYKGDLPDPGNDQPEGSR